MDLIVARAQSEQSAGQYGDAASDYAQATQLRPEVGELWANRGLMEYLAGEKTQAVVSFRRALMLKPALFTPLLFLGKAYNEIGKPEMALPLLKKARAAHPKDPNALTALGDSYGSLNNPRLAASAYREAATMNPSLPDAWFGLAVSALTLIDNDGRTLAGRYPQSVWSRALYADELFAQGRTTEAISLYKEVAADSSAGEAAVFAKTIRQMLQNPPTFALPANAAGSFEPILPLLSAKARPTRADDCPVPGKSQPRSIAPETRREQAACAFWRSDFEAAADFASMALGARPAEPEALYWSVKANERRAVAALAHFEDRAPHSAASHDMVGDLYRHRRQPDSAMQEYQKALAIDPHDHGALLGSAAAFFEEGKLEETVSAAQAGLADRPEDARLNLLVAEALVAARKYAEAKAYLQKSLAAPPELLLRVHALQGQIDASEGNTTAAIDELNLALPGDEDGSIHYQLARLYRKTGNLPAAQTAEAAVKTLQEQRRDRAFVAIQGSVPY